MRLLAYAVILALTACGTRGTGRTTTREPAIGPIKSLTDTKNLLLPLDEYMLSLDDYRHLAEARGILTRRCMERFGINYQAPTRPGTGLQTRNERRYGITDLTEARRYGYRQPQGSKVAPPPSSEQDRDPKVTAILVGEGARAFTSRPVPPGGCAGEAQRRLRASEQSAGVEDIAEPLAMKSWALSADDSRVQQVFDRWAACMKLAGLSYSTPLDVLQDRALLARLSPAQTTTAVTDAACKKEHNVVGVWVAVEMAYQQALIEADKPALERQRVANTARLQVAAAVVSKGR
ncbi:MAG TPA: hypothetical protein VEL76_10430 [Gemmataceae bacterium]|nr:hypothetical protein [Gemmataceae bacterium]